MVVRHIPMVLAQTGLGILILVMAGCADIDGVGSDQSESVEIEVSQSPGTPPPVVASLQPTSIPESTPVLTAAATSYPTGTSPEIPPTERIAPSPTSQATQTPTSTATPTLEPEPVVIEELQLNDIDGSSLTFLSVDEHPYFNGNTHIHGSLSMKTLSELSNVTLEISVPGEEVLITADLAPEALASMLLQPPGENGWVNIETTQLLFVIPSTEFHVLDDGRTAQLALTVRVQTADGHEASKTYERWVSRLVRYKSDNRYFVGEELQGGNDWVTPAVRELLLGLEGVLIGDISNMNGGPFPPHVSHQEGRDIDLWFPGYNAMDNFTAAFLLDLLNKPEQISRVKVVFAAYQQTDEDLFWSVIRDVTLEDGRPASEVFIPEPEHTTHFHLRLTY